MNETQERPATDVHEFNIVVLAVLARWYSQIAPNAPVRGYGAEEVNRSIHWHGNTYAASLGRKDNVPGIRLTVKKQDSNETLEDWWLPVEALDNVKVELPLVKYDAPV